MGRNKLDDSKLLKHEIKTRVNCEKFQELERILKGTLTKDMSSLLRDILHQRPVKVYTYDRSLDLVMEELSLLRAEVKAIGININQVTRFFNTYPEERKKEFYAKIAFAEHQRLEPKINELLSIISRLSKQWLSE
ncbi:MAG: hypothetical protein WCF67_01010 [Chitinophagaceae bacterium]